MPSPDFIHHFLPGQPGAPVLLLLHGTGGDENDLLELGASLFPGASRLSPRGKVLEHGRPRFFRRLAEGVFDEEDLIFRTNELADFVQAAAKHHGFEKAKIIAVGYSNGANIAAGMLLLRPEILSGAVLFRAMVPLVPKTLPDLAMTPIFLAGGRSDSMIPPESMERLAAMFRRAGANVTQHWSAGGHELAAPEMTEATRWLTSHFN